MENRKKNADRSQEASPSIITAGEVFADGAMIEMIESSAESRTPELLLWTGEVENIGAAVEHNGRIYKAPALEGDLHRAMRLPRGCCEYASARNLFLQIASLFCRHLGLSSHESRLLSFFAISTWLADRLPVAPNLALFGDEDLGLDILRLLSCLCRHPLALTNLTAGNFRALPMRLQLTLLLDQQHPDRKLDRLLRASTYQGLYVFGSGGRVVDLYGSKATFWGTGPVAGDARDAICVGVRRSASDANGFKREEESLVAQEFQAKLLRYRLNSLPKLVEVQIDVSSFSRGTRSIARAIASCFPDDADLAHEVLQLLRPQDDDTRAQALLDVGYAITEILWGLLHDGLAPEIRVSELTKNVNALLSSRGELQEYSSKEIGWKLRSLNINRHRDTTGRNILLNREASKRIHMLSVEYDLPLRRLCKSDCPDCAGLSSAENTDVM